MDPDTEDEQLVYEVTVEPKHGFLETKLNPGSPITSFTQGAICSAHFINVRFRIKTSLLGKVLNYGSHLSAMLTNTFVCRPCLRTFLQIEWYLSIHCVNVNKMCRQVVLITRHHCKVI